MFDDLASWLKKARTLGAETLTLRRSPVGKRPKWVAVDTWKMPAKTSEARLVTAIQTVASAEAETCIEPTVLAVSGYDSEGLAILDCSEKIMPEDSETDDPRVAFLGQQLINAQEQNLRMVNQILESHRLAIEGAALATRQAGESGANMVALLGTLAELQVRAGASNAGEMRLEPLIEAAKAIAETVALTRAAKKSQE